MDYAEAREVFFQPRDDAAPAPGSEAWSSPGRDLRTALEPVAMVGIWGEPVHELYAGLGLDFLTGYVWGRASALGEPEGSVVASAFGVFEPGLIGGLYDQARAACDRAAVRDAQERGAVAALRTVLGDAPDGVDDAVTALRRGADAADPTGRPLFAGLRAQPWPDEPLGRLWHAAVTLRELRGDTHLAACVANGLGGLEAQLLTELAVGWEAGSYTATRGWSPEDVAAARASLAARGLVSGEGDATALTDAGGALRTGVEAATERGMQPVLDAIGGDLPAVTAALGGWADAIVAHGWFPPDPYKRASG